MNRGARLGAALVAPLLVVSTVGVAGGVMARTTAVRWDSRVASIAKKVESLRELRFEHSVPVRFLATAAFKRRVTHDRDKLTKRDRRELQRAEATLRSLGLLEGSVNLLDALNAQQQSDVLAFYDPKKEEVVVRGTGPLDVEHRVTLAHELTHVLQDQHFDLEALQRTADKRNASGPLSALVEGDASRVEQDYVASLSRSERAAYEQSHAAFGDEVKAATKDVPAVVQVLIEAPYALGPEMVNVIRSTGGTRSIDAAFRRPPTTDQQFLDPLTAIHRQASPRVPVPSLAKTERRLGDPDSIGAFGLYLVLASRLDPGAALDTAGRWGADQSVQYRAGARSCLRAAFVGRRPGDTDRIRAGLEQWVAGAPAGVAKVMNDHGRVRLDSCDPGAAAPAPADEKVKAALILVAVRNGLLSEALTARAPESVARCAAVRAVGDPAVLAEVQREARDEHSTTDQATELRNAIRGVIRSCVDRG